MGNTPQSKGKGLEIMSKYTFIRQLSQGKNIYKHNASNQQYLTIQKTFGSRQMLAEYEQRMRPLLQISHPYYINQIQHAMIQSSTLCSMQYRIIHFFNYEEHSLLQQLQKRKSHEKYFEQKQIWSILCSIVLAMAHLTKNEVHMYEIHPKNIIIDKSGMIKILSPLINDNNTEQIQNNLYYSPEHLKAMKSQNMSQLSNKSSVFTLGITLLHILSLQPMNELYNYENYSINMQLLNLLIEKISKNQIKEIIKKMTKFHTYDRITFTQLQEMLYDVLQAQDQGYDNQNIDDLQNQSKLKSSILKIYQTGSQTINQNKSQQISYQTGSTSCKQLPFNQTQTHINVINSLQLFNDNQDIPNLPAYESQIDIQNIDEEDSNQKQYELQKNKLQQSKFTQQSVQLINSKLYQTGDVKTLRNPLKQIHPQHNITLGKPKYNSDFSDKIQNGVSRSLQQSYQQPNKPYHIREQLKRGVYQGYKLNSMRHGYGVFYYAEGGKYAGQWFKNKMEGRGALYYANDQIAYEGQWHNDKLHGYGILYNQLPTYISHPFDYKTLHIADNYWVKYEGNFNEDEKNGQGTLFLSNGEYYRGYFKNDLPHGNGIYKSLNGTITKGNWILGMMQ